MSKNFSVHWPIFYIRDKHKQIGRYKNTRNSFSDSCNETDAGLSNGIGCYLFVLKIGESYKPYYVGMASQRCFASERLGSHKILIYNEALNDQRGIPAIFLIAKRSKSGKLSKPSKNRDKAISWLESLLIGMCIEKNPKLKNISKTKLLKEMLVPGILNTPKGSTSLDVWKLKKAIVK